MRGSGIGGAVALGILALMLATVWTHPNGTRAAGNTLVSLEKNFGNQVVSGRA